MAADGHYKQISLNGMHLECCVADLTRLVSVFRLVVAQLHSDCHLQPANQVCRPVENWQRFMCCAILKNKPPGPQRRVRTPKLLGVRQAILRSPGRSARRHSAALGIINRTLPNLASRKMVVLGFGRCSNRGEVMLKRKRPAFSTSSANKAINIFSEIYYDKDAYLFIAAIIEDCFPIRSNAFLRFNALRSELTGTASYGIKINANKTMTMVIGRKVKNVNLRILNEAVEQVDSFIYLGCTISSNMSCCQEVKRRIAMAKEAFNRKRSIFCGPLEKEQTKILHCILDKRLRGVLVSVGCLAGTLCALLQLRLYLMGTRTPVFATADNPTARCPSAYTRFLTFAYLPVFNFGLLLWPRWLSFDWSMDAIPRITSLFDPRSTVTLLFYYLLYRITRRAFRKLTFSQNHLQQQQQKPQLYHRPRRHSHRRTAHVSAANIASKPHVSPAPLVHTGDITKATSSSPCPVCRHSLLDHHSALCRNNNNNNTIPMLGTSSAPCCCSNAVAKFSHQAAVVDGDAKKNVQPPRLRFTGKVYLSNSEVLLLSLAFIAVPFLPATNVFFYVGFVVAERVLYIPSIGYCLLIGLGCHVIHSRTNKSLVLVCVALLLAAFSVRTVQRNRDWMDEESLYRSGIPINPPKCE
ncbi:hypothetical protein ANN_04820 [Periplaneta americana]|uniref:DUF1736 domain-containing protein n=1 Tax=Periplaneta americana TaxID=6978 RepID=A0ABQ8T9G9_PERAM|nr:hypothetical protein ANN_04820 [Periplaneta americana]